MTQANVSFGNDRSWSESPSAATSVEKNNRKIARLSALYMAAAIIPSIVSVLALPVFTRYLSPDQLGIVTFAKHALGPIVILVPLGFTTGVRMQYFRIDESIQPQFIRSALIGQTAISGAVCLVLSIAGLWISNSIMADLPLPQNLVFVLWLMVVWGAFCQGIVRLGMSMAELLEQGRTVLSLRLLSTLPQILFGLAAVTLLAWQGFGRQGTIFAGAACAALFSIWIVWRLGSGYADTRLIRRPAIEGIKFVPHNLAVHLQFAISSFLLNSMISTGSLAIYGVALTFGALLEMPLGAVSQAAFPTLAKLMNAGSNDSRVSQSSLYTKVAIGIVSISVASALFSPIAIRLLTAPAYHEASTVVLVMIAAWLFHGFFGLALQPVMYHGGGLSVTMASVGGLIVTAVSSIILIPMYGIYGAAASTLLCFATKFAIALYLAQRIYPIPWETAKIIRALLCGSIIALAGVHFSNSLQPQGAIAVGVLLSASFVLLLYVTRVLSREEFRQLTVGVYNKIRRQ